MNKVVIFGIDGGSLKLIEQWQDELPNLKRREPEGIVEPGQREVAYREVDYEAERIRLKVKELKRLKKL